MPKNTQFELSAHNITHCAVQRRGLQHSNAFSIIDSGISGLQQPRRRRPQPSFCIYSIDQCIVHVQAYYRQPRIHAAHPQPVFTVRGNFIHLHHAHCGCNISRTVVQMQCGTGGMQRLNQAQSRVVSMPAETCLTFYRAECLNYCFSQFKQAETVRTSDS